MRESDKRDGRVIETAVDSFRKAGTAVRDGFKALYVYNRVWLGRRHSLVQFTVASAMWFVGNWTYNRIAPPIIQLITTVADRASSEFAVAPVVALLEGNSVLVFVQFLTVLIAVVVAQNRRHTQKLKKVEDTLTSMSKRPAEVTDGGDKTLPPTGPRAIGGAIAGGAIGISFGPGGLLAGVFLGFAIGDKRDIRAYERDSRSPDLNVESKAES